MTMSFRNMSCGRVGFLVLVVALGGLIAGCSDNNQLTPIDSTPPEAPVGLRASTNYTNIFLRWAANSETDLAGYNVYAAVDGGAIELVAVVPPTSNQYNETREREHTYSYTITAIDQANNESTESRAVTVMHNSQPGGGVRDVIVPVEP